MDQKLLRKVQLAQLEIACEIKRVCTENQIEYFLDSGSLLGAVRHQGFIPWDDDMDFGMLYKDYSKFIKIAPQKLGEQFFLQTWETDEYYPYPFCKVLKKGTEYVEDIFEYSKKRNELYVDIFPYYPFPDDLKIQRKQKRRIWVYRHLLMVQSGMTPWKRSDCVIGKAKIWMMYLPFILLAQIVSRENAVSKYKKAIHLSLKQTSGSFFSADILQYGTCVFPDSCFRSCVELPFENTKFKAPVDYKTYLQIVYGDYMQLPPESERENRHRIARIKL